LDLKQAILIRMDLQMGTGKKCVQACHASIISAEEARTKTPSNYTSWKEGGQKKVVLKVPDLETLTNRYQMARRMHIPASIIQDAGLTQLEPGTTTAAGIGPAPEDQIDKICGDLKLL
jgi:PTH2 family peptidyl-tRNA hydrolase